jgi:hypothetical protein
MVSTRCSVYFGELVLLFCQVLIPDKSSYHIVSHSQGNSIAVVAVNNTLQIFAIDRCDLIPGFVSPCGEGIVLLFLVRLK